MNIPNGDNPEPVWGANRRRFLRTSLGAAPILMTLVSRPVLGGGAGGGNWGGGGQCFTPSGFVSMPTSQHGQGYTCSGRTPGYWKNCDAGTGGHSWPSPYYPTTISGNWGHQATKFTDVFSPSPYPGSTTLLQVLEMGGGPPNDVARHIVAALLNVASGWTPVLTISRVQDIWNEYATKGYYEPTAGVKWYHDDIVNYLLSTMPI